MKNDWFLIGKFLRYFLIFQAIIISILIIASQGGAFFAEIFLIWIVLTIIIPILFIGYLTKNRGGRLNRAYTRLFHVYAADPYGLLLLIVLAGSFAVIWYVSRFLSEYLYYRNLISHQISLIIWFGGLLLAFPISFYLLVKVSDYLDLHGF